MWFQWCIGLTKFGKKLETSKWSVNLSYGWHTLSSSFAHHLIGNMKTHGSLAPSIRYHCSHYCPWFLHSYIPGISRPLTYWRYHYSPYIPICHSGESPFMQYMKNPINHYINPTESQKKNMISHSSPYVPLIMKNLTPNSYTSIIVRLKTTCSVPNSSLQSPCRWGSGWHGMG